MTNAKIDPTILVIFGITGELSRQRLLPALMHLDEHKLLPKQFSIVGFARSEFDHQTFRERARPERAKKSWKNFEKKIFYHRGDITNPHDFKSLAQFLSSLESRGHACANHLFYFATLPSHYETISDELSKSGLLMGCQLHKRQTRVIVEKPFGQDLASARKLDKTLHKYFLEEQIYRIDHYLAKETVQNLLTIRFANSIFEPIWNRNFIQYVEINAMESMGVGNRGAFYEQAGAMRDFVQNHMMQLLALTAMEPPSDLSTESIRDERAKIIRAVKTPKPRELPDLIVTGQYEGYRAEPNVSATSNVETFVALKLYIENPRWSSVPFYIRTGKRLNVAHKLTEISIHFKNPIPPLFTTHNIEANILTFTVQPKEGIYLRLVAKYPGFGIRLHPVTMELGYNSAFADEIPEAYERLLLDFMQGDQRLFARSDEIESSWVYIDTVQNYITKHKIRPKIYPAGSSGPKAAEDLMRKDNHQWHLAQSE